MFNSVTGWVAADVFTVISLSLLIFLKQPVEAPTVEEEVKHEVLTLPFNARLMRQSSDGYERFEQARGIWLVVDEAELIGLKDELIIACDSNTACAELWGAQSGQAQQFLLVLPTENKRRVHELFYNECKNAACDTGVVFQHFGNEVKMVSSVN